MSHIIDNAHTEEEHTSNNTVSKHLHRGTGQRNLTESFTSASREESITGPSCCCNSQQNDAHMAHAGVRNEFLHIRLHETDGCAIQDIDDCDHGQPAGELGHTTRK